MNVSTLHVHTHPTIYSDGGQMEVGHCCCSCLYLFFSVSSSRAADFKLLVAQTTFLISAIPANDVLLQDCRITCQHPSNPSVPSLYSFPPLLSVSFLPPCVKCRVSSSCLRYEFIYSFLFQHCCDVLHSAYIQTFLTFFTLHIFPIFCVFSYCTHFSFHLLGCCILSHSNKTALYFFHFIFSSIYFHITYQAKLLWVSNSRLFYSCSIVVFFWVCCYCLLQLCCNHGFLKKKHNFKPTTFSWPAERTWWVWIPVSIDVDI